MSEILLILGRIPRDSITNVLRFSCKAPVILVRFSRHLNFLEGFSKNIQISNFLKMRPVGTEFHADGRRHTGMTKLIVTSRNFTKAPNK
jgi:hypothetical protein